MPSIKTALPGPKSAELLKLYNQYVAQGVSHSTNLFAAEAQGALIKDVDGNVFLDFATGIGVATVGHCPPEVVDAISAQAGKFIHTSSNIVMYESYARVCEKLAKIAPVPDAKCMLVNSGAEAVENAVKIARKFTGRPGVVTLEGAFHGRTIFALGMTSKVKPYKFGFGPFPGDQYKIPCPNLYRKDVEMPDDDYAVYCAQVFEDMLETSLSPDMIACVVIEPVQGEGGMIPIPKAYLKKMREICTKHGIVMVIDEIQSGIARTGTMYAAEQLDVQPDLMTSAKALAGGLPLSAVIGRKEIMDASHVGGIGGTYSGNPVACASAVAVLDYVEKNDLCGKAAKLGDYLRGRVLKMMDTHECIGNVRGMGAMLGVEFVKDRGTKEPNKEIIGKITAAALQEGVIFLSAGTLGNVIRFLPAVTMNDEQAKFGMDVFEKAVKAACGCK